MHRKKLTMRIRLRIGSVPQLRQNIVSHRSGPYFSNHWTTIWYWPCVSSWLIFWSLAFPKLIFRWLLHVMINISDFGYSGPQRLDLLNWYWTWLYLSSSNSREVDTEVRAASAYYSPLFYDEPVMNATTGRLAFFDFVTHSSSTTRIPIHLLPPDCPIIPSLCRRFLEVNSLTVLKPQNHLPSEARYA